MLLFSTPIWNPSTRNPFTTQGILPSFAQGLSAVFWRIYPPFTHMFAADAVCRSAPLAHLIPQIKHSVRQGSELREPNPPHQLPPLEPIPALFITVKLINEFLILLQHGLIEPHLRKDLGQVSVNLFCFSL